MPELTCTRRLSIDGLPVSIFDAVMPADVVEQTYRALLHRRYESDHASSKSTKEYREWVCEIDLDDFRKDRLFDEMSRLVQACFADVPIGFFSVFCNCISYGCHTFRHQDGGENCYSALYYANPEWKVDWGGETTFFDSRGDAVACVAPVPGRIIVLDGRIYHRAGMPSRACPHRRYTVSLRCDGAGELSGDDPSTAFSTANVSGEAPRSA